jgi:ABC-type Fe3+-hydroxamate transport system substrate-binding protein
VRRRSLLLLAPLLLAACRERSSAGGPVAYRDDWGRRVALARPARRIVSLSPSTTELLFAMGLGERLVGRTHWCDWPPQARAIPDVGDGLAPNVEAVAARHPDLVLAYASEANRAAVERLEALGIRVAVLKLDLAEDVRRAAVVAGTLTGRVAAADSFLANFDRQVAEAARAAPVGRPRVRVYVDVESNPPITVGGGSYLTQILGLAGAVNVFEDIAAPSAPVSLESIIERDPDVVLTLGGPEAANAFATRGGWRALRAVREHRVIGVDPSLFGRPSPRLSEAVRVLAGLLRSAGERR